MMMKLRFSARWFILCLTFALLAGLLGASGAWAQPSVFINEIHYDNSGTDAGEGFEIAGPAGTDLSGWSVVLYNGSSSQRKVYNTVTLSGVIPDQQGGFGTLAYMLPSNGLQNGSPDGLALVDPAATVIQFLSYEGSFTAVDGPAAGMTSTDIGVTEASSTPVGNSLQLAGAGTTYADFAWSAHAPNTFGAINTGQTFGGGGGPATNLIINELDADQAGTDSAEFVELFDGGAGNTDLTGLVLVFFNGSSDTSYAAFDLDGFSTTADGYFVVCGNAATVPNCNLDGSPDTNFIQNGADAAAIYIGDAADFPYGTPVTTNNLLDALVYDTDDADDAGLLALLNPGQPQVNERDGGDGTAHSNQRCANGEGGARNTDTYTQALPTPGAENACGGGSDPFGLCGDPATLIHDIQGNGPASPLNGSTGVVVEGVVVGDYQLSSELKGFFVQEEDAQADADPATSEGVFVYDSGFGVDVAVGDVVRLQADVTEYYDMTEMNHVARIDLCSSGSAVTPVALTFPLAAIDDLEMVEGMLVTFPQELSVTETYNLDRYGEVHLAMNRLFQPTQVALPGADALTLQDLNDRSRILLDDANTWQNRDPIRYPEPGGLSAANTLRGGYTVSNFTGVLEYRFNSYRLQPTGMVAFNPANPRTAGPADVSGDLSVASFNVLNYFNGDGLGGGFPTSRGADTITEFYRQRDKIITAILSLNADVIGLMEIENDGFGPQSAIQDLVNGLNDAAGADTFAFIDPGVPQIGLDEIAVGLIYRTAAVAPTGTAAILDASVDPLFNSDKNRPALAQSFVKTGDGAAFTVVVNHLKSKGSPCDDIGDPNTGDGQGNCNLTRTNAVIALTNWLASYPTGVYDDDFIVIGDMNAYAMEDPIAAFEAAGYTNLSRWLEGPDAYSYVFAGQYGTLDYALSSPNLSGQVTGLSHWHINSDEPRALDYNEEYKSAGQLTSLYAPDAFRASDHDPVLVGLDLNAPPVCSAAAPSLASLWPVNHKFVAVDILNVTDPDGDPVTLTVESIFQDEPVNGGGDGNTAPDGQGVGTAGAELRAERDGGGNGRVYHLSFRADDGHGNVCTGTVQVGVPHNKKDTPVDDGPLFDSTVIP